MGNGRIEAAMKHYVVTGVSSGIGLELARHLVAKGHRVYGTVRQPEDADRVSKALGDRFTPLIMDVTDEASVLRAAQIVRGHIGSQTLAGLVNNAGITTHGPLLEMPMERVVDQLDTNMMGMLRVIRAFAPLLGVDTSLAGAPGRIVNISSGTAVVVPPFSGAFAMAAAAVEAMSDSLRRELLLVGIDVIIFSVGNTVTPFWDKAEAQDPEQYRNSIFFEALMRFRVNVLEYARNEGRSAEYMAIRIGAALAAKRPKAKYVTSPNVFLNYIWPRMMPRRTLDRALGNSLGLLPPKE